MTAGGGCFVANLDVETTWARGAGLHPRALSARARAMASRVGALCAALAPEARSLWTLEPLDPRCLRSVPGLHRPELISGPPPAEPLDRWGDPGIGRIGHRRWAFEHGEAWGTVLPDAAFVDSVEALLVHPASGGPWVAKAPWSTAGRGLVRGRGRALREVSRRRVRRLLAEQGELLVEPWLDRLIDIGCVVDPSGTRLHQLEVDANGAFVGIGPLQPDSLAREQEALLRALAAQVGRDLVAAGYRGPYGIDAFLYRGRAGSAELRPLCEVNPRYTVGHIAHALGAAARATWGSDAWWRLSIAAAPRPDEGVTDRMIPLLGSADGRTAEMWLERVDG